MFMFEQSSFCIQFFNFFSSFWFSPIGQRLDLYLFLIFCTLSIAKFSYILVLTNPWSIRSKCICYLIEHLIFCVSVLTDTGIICPVVSFRKIAKRFSGSRIFEFSSRSLDTSLQNRNYLSPHFQKSFITMCVNIIDIDLNIFVQSIIFSVIPQPIHLIPVSLQFAWDSTLPEFIFIALLFQLCSVNLH